MLKYLMGQALAKKTKKWKSQTSQNTGMRVKKHVKRKGVWALHIHKGSPDRKD